MTDPTVIFQDNQAVAQGHDGAPIETEAGAEQAASQLAAIQHSYEEAKADIVDDVPPWSTPGDDEEPFPATQKLDVRTLGLPAVPGGAVPSRGRKPWWRSLRTARHAPPDS